MSDDDAAQAIRDRAIEIRCLTQTARAIVDISPEAARAVREAARVLEDVQRKAVAERVKRRLADATKHR